MGNQSSLEVHGSETGIESVQKTLNIAVRRILGSVKTTPIQAMHVEVGIMPLHYRLFQTVVRQGLRLCYKLNPNIPLRNDFVSPLQWSLLKKMNQLLAERLTFLPAVEVCLSSPLWGKRSGPSDKVIKEWINLPKEINKESVQKWQANYGKKVESGKNYRQDVKG